MEDTGKVINFPGTVTEEPKEVKPTISSEHEQKLKTQLSLLPQYRGEVSSKNNIRMLPDLKRGEIFWVTLDHCPYAVADVDIDKKGKTRVVIKRLDETATISTGMTLFDMNKGIVSKEPLLDWNDKENIEGLAQRFCEWFNEDGDSFYLLYGRDIHYVTLFNAYTTRPKDNFLYELKGILGEVGDIISIDFDTVEGNHCVEIWVRMPNSPAELLYLMPYDKGVIEI